MSLIVFREATVEAEPCNAAFNNPRDTGDLESSPFALDDLQAPAVASQLPCKLAALMASISNHGPDGRPKRREPGQQAAARPPIGHIGWFNAIRDWKVEGINQDMAFSSLHSLVPIEATSPSCAAVFTDWPSMVTTVGSGVRPAANRACE